MKNKKGITFIEAIINIYIYSLLISICATVSVAYIKTRIFIRQKQQAIEEISLTINEMAKTLRMSSACDDGNCFGTDDVELKRIKKKKNEAGGGNAEYEISGNNLKSGSFIMLEKVDGNFSVTRPDGIPLITIELWKLDKTNVEIPGTRVRTSVSLRSRYGDNEEE